MCGICGVYSFGGRLIDPDTLRLMTASLVHRGPDGSGIVVFGAGGMCRLDPAPADPFLGATVGLGHRRLSVIDVEGGSQPMSNEDQTVWVVLNGEIYNFRELRSKCEEKGHRFSTRSDTEVILHLYEDHGADCLQYLEGMFAFALWDTRSGTLLLARDRLGQKPIYYYLGRDKLVFGSELKAVIVDPDVPREIDWQALHHYLTYLSIPGGRSVYRGIEKLPAGHYLQHRPGETLVRRYWDLEPHVDETADRDRGEEIRQSLREAVEKRLVSDVPLGAFLSGGVDSSAVVAMMAQISDAPVKTFSVGFSGDSSYDELGFARQVADRFGTEHTECVVTPNVLDDLPVLARHWDEPFAVSSAIPLYYLARVAREHVTVALSGDGADELFAGYTRYLWDAWADRLTRLPAWSLKAVDGAIGLLPSSAAGTVTNQIRRARRFSSSLLLERDERYLSYFTFFDEEEKSRLCTPQVRELTDGCRSVDLLSDSYRPEDTSGLNRRLLGDIRLTLESEMLAKVDRMSMAVGLEVRSPFMDHQLVELACRTPARLKLNGRETKHILKRALKDDLPASILYRRKHGFEVPIDEWIRGDLRDYVGDMLAGDTLREQGIFQPHYVGELLKQHLSGNRNLGHRIWILLMFQVWYQAVHGAR